MLIGSGVAGGQVIGGFYDYIMGQTVNLDTGAVGPDGEPIYHSHLGATMMALGDVDPGDYLVGVDPIWAAMQ